MDDPKITEDLIAAHGLKPDEYERILEIIGREPTFTGMPFSLTCSSLRPTVEISGTA